MPTTSSAAPTSPTSPAVPTSSSPGTAQAAIYWVGRTPRGTRLFSELRDVAAGDPLAGAAAVLTTGAPLDPDYTSLVPSTLQITSVRQSDGRIIVQVSPGSPLSPDKGTSPRDASLAVQQLVYTLQAASGTHSPVQVVQGGGGQEVPTPLYGQDTVNGVKAQPQLKVLALVDVTSPRDGAVVTGDTLKVTGLASSFEANVPWSVHRGSATGRVVASGAATAAGYLGRLFPWSTEVDVSALAPGDYTFVASTDEPAEKEGSKATVDTKAFTLQ